MECSIKTFFKAAAFIGWAIFSGAGFAHGDNVPGPHGGFIRMPGAFHTEVAPYQKGFKIFLLDMHFQNPLTRLSSVNAEMTIGHDSVSLKCKSKEDYFDCRANPEQMTHASELKITAVRDNAKGATVSYSLPLKLA